jgi:hypothetical protein
MAWSPSRQERLPGSCSTRDAQSDEQRSQHLHLRRWQRASSNAGCWGRLPPAMEHSVALISQHRFRTPSPRELFERHVGAPLLGGGGLDAGSDRTSETVAMTKATHATLATFRVDLARESEQRTGLERMIVPGVVQHPGFVSGTWTLDRSSAESFVMLTYESEESAEAMRTRRRPSARSLRERGG